ncbi:hypothetical protein EVAR_61614_1 [Eumeta japonica]|uniref:Uncharacterized protein n=1 Tax=Eumeta variegata TaxID=151549 RepID=A0A4C1ZGB1_EUMVA|nr:hypothetical protein EVAR_61614_1 [Eumeta japonica]
MNSKTRNAPHNNSARRPRQRRRRGDSAGARTRPSSKHLHGKLRGERKSRRLGKALPGATVVRRAGAANKLYGAFAVTLSGRSRKSSWSRFLRSTNIRDVYGIIFLRRCPKAETLSRHESPDCGRRRGLRMGNNADTTNAT